MENGNTSTYCSFEKALSLAKEGHAIARSSFRDTCYIKVQQPDENSKMKLPYLYMVKKTPTIGKFPSGYICFPVDLSCESIFADDWYLIPKDQELEGKAAVN